MVQYKRRKLCLICLQCLITKLCYVLGSFLFNLLKWFAAISFVVPKNGRHRIVSLLTITGLTIGKNTEWNTNAVLSFSAVGKVSIHSLYLCTLKAVYAYRRLQPNSKLKCLKTKRCQTTNDVIGKEHFYQCSLCKLTLSTA